MAMRILPIRALTPEWFEYRRQRVSSTDVAAICGLSPWKTALEVWMRITGRHDPDPGEGGYLEWGARLEEVNRLWTEREAGVTIEANDALCSHPERDWYVCTLDGIVQGEPLATWEGKAPSVWSRDAWAEGKLPQHYEIQVAAGLEITGMDRGLLSALIPPGPPLFRWVERDAEVGARLLERVDRFWHDNVLKDAPPPVQGKADRAMLAVLHPEDTGQTVMLGAEAVEATYAIDELKQATKQAEEEQERLKNKIRLEIGDNTFGVLPEGGGWKWARNARGVRVLTRHSKL